MLFEFPGIAIMTTGLIILALIGLKSTRHAKPGTTDSYARASGYVFAVLGAVAFMVLVAFVSFAYGPALASVLNGLLAIAVLISLTAIGVWFKRR